MIRQSNLILDNQAPFNNSSFHFVHNPYTTQPQGIPNRKESSSFINSHQYMEQNGSRTTTASSTTSRVNQPNQSYLNFNTPLHLQFNSSVNDELTLGSPLIPSQTSLDFNLQIRSHKSSVEKIGECNNHRYKTRTVSSHEYSRNGEQNLIVPSIYGQQNYQNAQADPELPPGIHVGQFSRSHEQRNFNVDINVNNNLSEQIGVNNSVQRSKLNRHSEDSIQKHTIREALQLKPNNNSAPVKINKIRREKADPKIEAYIDTITKNDLNSISLLNEVNGKLKRKVDYKITESLVGRTRVFECVCLLEEQQIGCKKGNSKQTAKSEAAKDGIRTMLSDPKFVVESSAIILSIQKSTDKGKNKVDKKDDTMSFLSSFDKHSVNIDNNESLDLSLDRVEKASSDTTIPDDVSVTSSFSPKQEISQISHNSKNVKNEITTKPPLYELNIYARKMSLEPLWTFPFETNEEGEFEISLQFGDLIIYEKGKRKLEAKKEAAAKMVEKIKMCEKLGTPVVSEKSRNSILKNIVPLNVKDKNRAKKLFMSAIGVLGEDKLKKIQQTKPLVELEGCELENRIIAQVEENEMDVESDKDLQVLFEKMVNFTSIVTSNPKQIMLEAEKHIADYVKDCYLTPIGDFALGCMNNDNSTIESVLTFRERNSISDNQLLELYQNSLEVCQKLDQQSGTNTLNLRFEFTIKSEDSKTYLEVSEVGKSNGKLKLKIYVLNQEQTSMGNEENIEINFAQEMYASLNKSSEELNNFRSLLKIQRLLCKNNDATLAESRVMDSILLQAVLSKKAKKMNAGFTSYLSLLGSKELTEAALSKSNSFYSSLYQDLSAEVKDKLTTISKKSLTSILNKEF